MCWFSIFFLNCYLYFWVLLNFQILADIHKLIHTHHLKKRLFPLDKYQPQNLRYCKLVNQSTSEDSEISASLGIMFTFTKNFIHFWLRIIEKNNPLD